MNNKLLFFFNFVLLFALVLASAKHETKSLKTTFNKKSSQKLLNGQKKTQEPKVGGEIYDSGCCSNCADYDSSRVCCGCYEDYYGNYDCFSCAAGLKCGGDYYSDYYCYNTSSNCCTDVCSVSSLRTCCGCTTDYCYSCDSDKECDGYASEATCEDKDYESNSSVGGVVGAIFGIFFFIAIVSAIIQSRKRAAMRNKATRTLSIPPPTKAKRKSSSSSSSSSYKGKGNDFIPMTMEKNSMNTMGGMNSMGMNSMGMNNMNMNTMGGSGMGMNTMGGSGMGMNTMGGGGMGMGSMGASGMGMNTMGGGMGMEMNNMGGGMGMGMDTMGGGMGMGMNDIGNQTMQMSNQMIGNTEVNDNIPSYDQK
ncbi:hypothetical protein M0812_20789 [Anaeramoeba flamelloides]|uniref:Uncharacterized protein n=1 Tax=Anaeramoeba flamelloides TaxID=1746091 RepID=A0AAV7YTV4_9EUKA|nr:hypothetical protein M0812_20789 [Anaeramoeba flamelloides]